MYKNILFEVETDDINLSSFKIHKKLNQKIWKDEKIDSKVRLKLLDIADEFYSSLAIDWVKIEDIILTGSLANYNWSKYSDVDLHILIDFKKVWKKTDTISEYFKTKKKLWSIEHDNLKVLGFPVEVYIQDINEKHNSSGIYSLNKNKWLVEPDDFQNSTINEETVKNKSAKEMTYFDDLFEKVKKEKDKHKLETIYNKILKRFKRLRTLRSESLDTKGELGTYNIVWKVLRRTGYIDKINDTINELYDKINTIN